MIRHFIGKLSLGAGRAIRKLRPYYISVIFSAIALGRFMRRRAQIVPAKGNSSPTRILVIRLDAIGDLVMSTLVFRELKLRFPESEITAVVQSQCRPILETNPYVDRLLSPPKIHRSRLLHRHRQDLAMLQLYWKHLRGQTFDLVLNPRFDGDLYSADALIKLVDCPHTVKYEDNFVRGFARYIHRLAFRWADQVPTAGPRHEVLSSIAIIEHLTGQKCTSEPELFLTPDDLAYSRKILAKAPAGSTIVGVGFGAQAMRRAWPLERWAEVIRALSLRRNIFPLLICSNSEVAVGRRLQGMVSIDSHLMSGANLRQVGATIQACDLFVGPDSGLAHMAAAVKCPVVVVSPHPLSGDPNHGNSPIRFGPYTERARVIQPLQGRPPCVTGCDAVTPHCILQIQPGQIIEACETLLNFEQNHLSDKLELIGQPGDGQRTE